MGGPRGLLPAIVGVLLMCGVALPAPASAGTCTDVQATLLSAGTKAPDGSALTPPITDWEQVSAQCSPAASTVRIHVPDCQPGCGSTHRQIVEWWAHAPSASTCTPSAMPNANDTLTCPGKPDGRICVYLRKDPGPEASSAIVSESLHVVFGDTSVFDATPSLESATVGCGPGDHPVNTAPPQVSGTPQVGASLTCDPGSWSGDSPLVPHFQWRRGGLAIPGAQFSTYTPVADDVNHIITCDVTMTNPEDDDATASSGPVTVVAAANPDDNPGNSVPPGSDSIGDCELTIRKHIVTKERDKFGYADIPGIHNITGEEYAVATGTIVEFQILVSTRGACPEIALRDLLPASFKARRATGELTHYGVDAPTEQLQTEFTATETSEQAALSAPPTSGIGVSIVWTITGTFTTLGDQTNQARIVAPISVDSNPVRVHVVTYHHLSQIKANVDGVSGDDDDADERVATSVHERATAADPSVALSKAKRIEVAVRRLDGKGAKSCLWLGDTRAHFKKVRGKGAACASTIWLKARGTRHWALRFKRRLPRGRYLVEARVIDVAGVATDPADSQRRFKVR
jgi:hypothetical protein